MDVLELIAAQGGISGVMTLVVAGLKAWSPLNGRILGVIAVAACVALTFAYRLALIEQGQVVELMPWSTALYGLISGFASMAIQQSIKRAGYSVSAKKGESK